MVAQSQIGNTEDGWSWRVGMCLSVIEGIDHLQVDLFIGACAESMESGCNLLFLALN